MIRVGPTLAKPTHHVKLSRDGKEVGLILCNGRGEADETALRRDNLPASALKTYTGESTHADAEPPFRPIEQKDWSGGRAALIFETDATRYYDAGGVNATAAGKLMLGPLATFTEGMKDFVMDMPGSVSWVDLYGADRFHSQIHNSGAGWHAYYLECIAYAVGTPGNLTLGLYSNGAGSPNVLLGHAHYPYTTNQDGMPMHIRVSISYGLGVATDYHLVISGESTDNANNHWVLAVHDSSTGRKSTAGSSWVLGSAPYGRITVANGGYHARFFEYKRSYYAMQIFDDDSVESELYRLGYRGVAQTNAGQLDRLIDVNQSWTVDSLVGSIVEVIRGPGSDEVQPWREVASNTATAILVDDDWKTIQTATTEYVVHQKVWHKIGGMGGKVSDIAVSDEFCYFARGETSAIKKWYEFNWAGYWNEQSDSELLSARYLLFTRHPSLGNTLWGGCNSDVNRKTVVWRAKIPEAWGQLYQDMGEMCPTNNPWDSAVITSVTQSKAGESTMVSAGAGITGTIAVQNLDAPVDITKGSHLGVLLQTSKAIAASQLQLVYDDVEGCGKSWLPIQATVLRMADGTYTDLPLARDGFAATIETLTGTAAATPHAAKQLTTGQGLLIGCDQPFNKITFGVGVANATPATFACYYYKSGAWTAVSSFVDGTLTGGNTTLGQDGSMTFTTPHDWEKYIAGNTPVEGYYIFLIPGASVDATTTLEDITLYCSNAVVLNFPAIAYAYQEQFYQLAISPNQFPLPDETNIKSFSLRLLTNTTGTNIFMRGGIRLTMNWPEYIKLPVESRITGMIPYVYEENENPIVFTETIPYVIQQENQNIAVPMGLNELATLRSPNSGRASTVQGVYLWFALGDDYIQRYYNRQLDDVSYTQDEGMPSNRNGRPAKMITWTDKVLVAVDGGEADYSSVMLYNGRGWHEFYRAPNWGWRILDIGVHTAPGEVDNLWISVGDDVIYLPLSPNPLQETGYHFNYAGYLRTARFTGGMQDVIKYVHSIKLASDYLDAYSWGCWVKADYRIAGTTTWTEITDTFDTSPYQEVALEEENNVTTRWFEIRLRLFTGNQAYTPLIYGTVLQVMMFSQIKFVYNLVFRLADEDNDLNGDRDAVGYKAKFDQLNTWARGALPIMFNSNSTLDDGTYVFPGPTPLRRKAIIKDPDTQREINICQMTLIEVS